MSGITVVFLVTVRGSNQLVHEVTGRLWMIGLRSFNYLPEDAACIAFLLFLQRPRHAVEAGPIWAVLSSCQAARRGPTRLPFQAGPSGQSVPFD